MRDSQMILVPGTSNLTTTTTSGEFSMGPTPIKGLSCTILVPEQAADTTLEVTLEESLDGSHWDTFLTFDPIGGASAPAATGPQLQSRKFDSRAPYIQAVLTVSGTSPNFGAVQVWLGDAVGWNYNGWQARYPASTDTRAATV